MKYQLRVLKSVATGVIILMAFLCCSVSASADEMNSWQNEITLYGWLAGIDGTTRFSSGVGSDIEVETSDIVEDISMLFMGSYAGHYGRWSILADVLYVDIGDSTATTIGGVTASAGLDIASWVLHGGVGFDIVQSDRATLAVVGGVRYLLLDAEAELDIMGTPIKTVSESENIFDGIVGLRGSVKLTDCWYIPYYADIGTGDSEFTYQLFAGIGYLFSWGDIRLGYRYLSYDLEDDKLLKDLTISGAILGLGFRF